MGTMDPAAADSPVPSGTMGAPTAAASPIPSSSLSDMVMQLMPVLMVDLSPIVAATGVLLDASDA